MLFPKGVYHTAEECGDRRDYGDEFDGAGGAFLPDRIEMTYEQYKEFSALFEYVLKSEESSFEDWIYNDEAKNEIYADELEDEQVVEMRPGESHAYKATSGLRLYLEMTSCLRLFVTETGKRSNVFVVSDGYNQEVGVFAIPPEDDGETHQDELFRICSEIRKQNPGYPDLAFYPQWESKLPQWYLERQARSLPQ